MNPHIPPKSQLTLKEYQEMKKPGKRKYRNEKGEADGILFDSQKEKKRYGILKMMQRGKVISDLRLQVRYPIVINKVLVCTYIADFVYERAGKTITEDAKGMRTAIFILKKKLMKAVLGIEILET